MTPRADERRRPTRDATATSEGTTPGTSDRSRAAGAAPRAGSAGRCCVTAAGARRCRAHGVPLAGARASCCCPGWCAARRWPPARPRPAPAAGAKWYDPVLYLVGAPWHAVGRSPGPAARDLEPRTRAGGALLCSAAPRRWRSPCSSGLVLAASLWWDRAASACAATVACGPPAPATCRPLAAPPWRSCRPAVGGLGLLVPEAAPTGRGDSARRPARPGWQPAPALARTGPDRRPVACRSRFCGRSPRAPSEHHYSASVSRLWAAAALDLPFKGEVFYAAGLSFDPTMNGEESGGFAVHSSCRGYATVSKSFL